MEIDVGDGCVFGKCVGYSGRDAIGCRCGGVADSPNRTFST